MPDEVKLVVGPRGPAGDISAAVNQAKAIVVDAEKRVQEKASQFIADAESRVQSKADVAISELKNFRTEIAALRAEIAALRAYLDERIENAVVLHVVQTLEDYGVKDRNGNAIVAK